MTDTYTPAAEAPSPARAPRRWRAPAMLAPLGQRDYRLLFIGQLISSIGNTFYSVALPWYMLTQGGGPANLGLALTAYGIPMGAMTLLGGWLSDKLRARRVMLVSDFARIFVLGGLAWATFGVHAPLWQIAALTAALGAFDGLFMPASQAIAPDILPDEQLQSANGLFYALMRLAQMVGPALAGLVVARASSSGAFAIDAATFLVSTATLLFIRNRVSFAPVASRAPGVSAAASAEAQQEQGAQPVADSLWRFAVSAPYTLILLIVIIIGNLLNGAVGEVAIPALAQGPLHAGAQGYGLILGGFGGGALIGALLASALGNRISRGVYSLHFFAAQAAVIFALAFSVNAVMAVALMASFGLLNSLGNVTFMTLLQRRLPRNLLGRIMGVMSFCNFATLPLSVAAGGFATARFGPSPVIMVGAGLLLLAMLIAYTSRDLRNL
jgi:predicted MFS family arabinose efflux permease